MFFIIAFPFVSEELPLPEPFTQTDTLDKGSWVAASRIMQEKLFCEKPMLASKLAARSHTIFFMTIKRQDTTTLRCLLR
jgi:hypothetical protein